MSEDSENMPDVIKDFDRMPSDLHTPKAVNEKEMEGLEEHIDQMNSLLDQLNDNEDEQEGKPTVEEEKRMDEVPQFDDASMPEELDVNEMFENRPESEHLSEIPKGRDTEMTSVANLKIEADEADSGDNTEDLDPISQFEKRRENIKSYHEQLKLEIIDLTDQLEVFRNKIKTLEDEEYSFYSVSKSEKNSNHLKLYSNPQSKNTHQDPGALKLEYCKAL
jgi:hypothetical protein